MAYRASLQYLCSQQGSLLGGVPCQALVASMTAPDPSVPRASASVPVTSNLGML